MRYTLDVMHIEKNVAATAVGFFLSDSDSIVVRKDREDANCMPHLHLVWQGTAPIYVKPHDLYVLTREKRKQVLQAVHVVRTPSGNSANIEKLVNLEKEKLHFMNTHEWHVLL